jgi:hypothetical protein
MIGLTANSMFNTLGSSDTLGIQESSPDTHSVRSQTERFHNIRSSINTSINVYFEWLRCLLGGVIFRSQSFWI